MHEVPGGPFLSEKAPSAAVTAALEAKYGLDKPKSEQFVTYLKGIMKGDFGPSIKQRGREVTTVIMQGFKVSFKLGGTAAAIALAIGIVLGSIAAIFHNRIIDKIIMVVTTGLVAMPSFIIATLLLLVFCVWMGIFPANGNEPGGLVLPIISLSLYPMSYTTRLTRSSMLDVLGQDYIRTARAKGVKPGKVLFKHALRNAVTPVVTYAGPMFAYIITGSLVVEKIFAVPGLGKEFVSSIINRDYTMIMGTTIFLGVLIVIMMLVSDILYKVFDPRIDLG
jgi:oligopeptide transport system permease protein